MKGPLRIERGTDREEGREAREKSFFELGEDGSNFVIDRETAWRRRQFKLNDLRHAWGPAELPHYAEGVYINDVCIEGSGKANKIGKVA